MTTAETSRDLPSENFTPNIYLNNDVIDNVCLLPAENRRREIPQKSSDDVTSISDDIVHCSLPNLSPVHGGRLQGKKKYCPQHNHYPCNRHTVCYGGGNVPVVYCGSSHSNISAYCSPKAGRKKRPSSYSTKDLSSLRAECYLKSKRHLEGGRSRQDDGRNRPEGGRSRQDSGDSVDSDHGTLDSVSHISTCATSDYAYMTSLDTIAMLCKDCQKCHTNYYNQDTLTPALSDLDICTTLRRTHSNPENCKLPEADVKSGRTEEPRMLRDARSCSELNMDDSLHSSQNSASLQNKRTGLNVSDNKITSGPVAASETLRNKENQCAEVVRVEGRREVKSIAISEENLVSRVSRWLSTVDSGESFQSDVF